MSGDLPRFEHDLVLAGVKAEPSGRPPAPALTPTPGEARWHRPGAGRLSRSTILKPLRFQGIANSPRSEQPLPRRRVVR